MVLTYLLTILMTSELAKSALKVVRLSNALPQFLPYRFYHVGLEVGPEVVDHHIHFAPRGA